jgi:hypothetical protein
LGVRGELSVFAFLIWARDNAIVKQPAPPLSVFCGHFLVEELFSCLFFKRIVKSMFKRKPSIGPSNAEKQTLGEVASAAHSFQPLHQSARTKVVAHQYLLGVMAQGAAVSCANCQAGVDMVFPYLYDSTNLEDKNVGFIMVQASQQ